MEAGEKGAAMGASVVTYNPYSETYRACIHSLKPWWWKIIVDDECACDLRLCFSPLQVSSFQTTLLSFIITAIWSL